MNGGITIPPPKLLEDKLEEDMLEDDDELLLELLEEELEIIDDELELLDNREDNEDEDMLEELLLELLELLGLNDDMPDIELLMLGGDLIDVDIEPLEDALTFCGMNVFIVIELTDTDFGMKALIAAELTDVDTKELGLGDNAVETTLPPFHFRFGYLEPYIFLKEPESNAIPLCFDSFPAVVAKSIILCVLSTPNVIPFSLKPEGNLIALPSSVRLCPAFVTDVFIVEVPTPVIVPLAGNFPKYPRGLEIAFSGVKPSSILVP